MTLSVTADFLKFLDASPSAFHAASNVESLLVDAGYAPDSELTPGGHVAVAGGAVLAWWVPHNPNPRVRIVGTHTDSPGLMVKPDPDFVREGFSQVAVEVYGGPILSSWFDRDIRFAGRVVTKDGSVSLVDTGAVARVPNLAIHLTRGADSDIDRQVHLQPILGGDLPLSELVAHAAGVTASDVVAHELISADSQPAAVVGDSIMSGRLDNLSSVFASVKALLRAQDDAEDFLVLAAFNHEEVGSASTTGAGGPLLERLLARIAASVGDPLRFYADSLAVSADAAHSVHPNYPGKHDPTHRPLLGKGPVLKLNANQRYASDAVTSAAWIRAARASNVPVQTFVGHNDVPCGSTIGPISSTRLGIPTVDVGVPLLSMHSAREQVGVQDIAWFTEALTSFLRGD
ncbi:M18 family aminopeptidase [Corynebacterium lipophiloflavum]|uniref:M18 family aminopeptidase n=1 Tax=Corynebacterium lipophiloflavum (strain ATCC 700352 / DSM 44291 / CCUG 37336 / JCM 10383 / DMMZ 1944) TaxID=525263 RepID=C0XT23_CORLD|nr:M18 family aminopeptidase [Corynebacterium lipophiloflavum]EEI16562.1 aminopeptidase I zinc metalloprotease (M18) [Corynebacterium lipophiloflavum DSM 44291]